MDFAQREKEAREVGASFCKLYVEIASSPFVEDRLHRLYKPNAILSFGSEETVVGISCIQHTLLAFKDARFEVRPEHGATFVFQPTFDSGVLVVMTGFVWLKSVNVQRFCHTSLLSREADSKFFISNDMHTFSPISTTLSPSVPASPSVPSNRAGSSLCKAKLTFSKDAKLSPSQLNLCLKPSQAKQILLVEAGVALVIFRTESDLKKVLSRSLEVDGHVLAVETVPVTGSTTQHKN